MLFLAASMLISATANNPIILEHCVEETEQSEPFCFLEKVTESTVTIVTTAAMQDKVLNLELILPTDGPDYESIRDVSLNVEVVPDLDYFEQSKDIYGGFFYEPWKLDEFDRSRHTFSKDPAEALKALNQSVQPYGFEGPKPDYQSRYPKIGNPYLMNCQSDCAEGIVAGSIQGFGAGFLGAVTSVAAVTSGAPHTPATIPIRVAIGVIAGFGGAIHGAISASQECKCSESLPPAAQESPSTTENPTPPNQDNQNDAGAIQVAADENNEIEIPVPEVLPANSTPNPSAPATDAPPLPSDPYKELKKGKPSIEDVKPNSRPVIITKPISPVDPLPMMRYENRDDQQVDIIKNLGTPIDPPKPMRR